jgi:RNA polymerase sigma-70 factor (ECF subfamily)
MSPEDAPPPPESTAPGAPRVDASWRRRGLLHRAHDDGRREYPGVALDFAVYARRALDLATRRVERGGVAPTDARVDDALERAHGADLYLAIACDAGLARSWETLEERVLPGLSRVAARRGASAAEAQDVLAELPGELCSPPPSGGARTRLGSYDGSGSLFAWLAVVVARRVADLRRASYTPTGRAATSLEASGESAPAPAATDAASRRPIDRLVLDEEASRFREALRRAWRDLTDREALVLLWKHRDGLAQRDIARLLDVGEPRVSRLLDAALAKLRTTIQRAGVAGPGGGASAPWLALADALRTHLASSAPFHDVLERDPSSHD